MEDEFGDFKEVKEEAQKQNTDEQEVQARIRLPRKNELLGKVMQRLGGNRMEIKCTDGKSRNCRVPGRLKRKLWLREGDLVIITPWPDDDNKGDIIFQYNKNAHYQLKNHGLLKNLEESF